MPSVHKARLRLVCVRSMHVRPYLANLYSDAGKFCRNIYASHTNLTLAFDDTSGVPSMLIRPISVSMSRLSTGSALQRFSKEARAR